MNQQEFHMRQIRAQRLLQEKHYHQDGRENCTACCANGYNPRGGWDDGQGGKFIGVNYAGWARVWIEAGKFISAKFEVPFLMELASSNRAYADCLRQDIKDFGIACRPSFKIIIQQVLND